MAIEKLTERLKDLGFCLDPVYNNFDRFVGYDLVLGDNTSAKRLGGELTIKNSDASSNHVIRLKIDDKHDYQLSGEVMTHVLPGIRIEVAPQKSELEVRYFVKNWIGFYRKANNDEVKDIQEVFPERVFH